MQPFSGWTVLPRWVKKEQIVFARWVISEIEKLADTLAAIALRVWPVLVALTVTWIFLIYTEQGNDVLAGAKGNYWQTLRLALALFVLCAAAGFSTAYLLSLPPEWDKHGFIARFATHNEESSKKESDHSPANDQRTIRRVVVGYVTLLIISSFSVILAYLIGDQASGFWHSVYSFMLPLTWVVLAFILAIVLTRDAELRRRARNVGICCSFGLLVFAWLPVQTGLWLGADFTLFLLVTFWLLVACVLIGQLRVHRIQYSFLIMTYAVLWVVNAIYNLLAGVPAPAPLIRCTDGLCKPANQHVRTLDAEFDKWRSLNSSDGKPVLLLVAAAGGGARASYWTSIVLGHLTDQKPDSIRRHLFVSSGVSGGALGVTVHRSLLAQERLACDGNISSIEGCSRRFGEGDFLAPNIAALLTTDVWNAAFPGQFFAGRDVALEQGWEHRWSQVVGGSAFRNSFLSLWPPSDSYQPNLILNATSTRRGERLIISNLDANSFLSVGVGCRINLAQFVNLPVSAAVNSSARFPYIDPPGAVKIKPCKKNVPGDVTVANVPGDVKVRETAADVPADVEEWETVADGGYYDNFGAATLLDLLDGLEKYAGKRGKTLSDLVRPIFVQITSDPTRGMAEALDAAVEGDKFSEIAECKRRSPDQPKAPLVQESWWEWLRGKLRGTSDFQKGIEDMERRLKPADPLDPAGPFGTLMKARTRSSSVFPIELRKRMKLLDGSYYHFAMDGTVSAPLGWSLSQKARGELDKLLKSECHKKQIDLLLQELPGPRT